MTRILIIIVAIRIALPVIADDSRAQKWAKPSWTKKLNTRTVHIKYGWENFFVLPKEAHIIASVQVYSDTDWGNSHNPSSLLGVAVDGRLASHVVTYFGREFHHYTIHLGRVPAGEHSLEIVRSDTSRIQIRLVNVLLEVYEASHPQYPILANAPLLFGRREMRYSDVPLLLTYKARYHDDAASANPRLQEIEYAFVYSNSDHEVSPQRLLHRYGRYADIIPAFRVTFDSLGYRDETSFFAVESDSSIFRGGFENEQPTVQIVSLDKRLSDSLTTRLRFSLPPIYEFPESGMAEDLLLQAPWTWRVSAGEARRERSRFLGEQDKLIDDLQDYLFFRFLAKPRVPGDTCKGFFVAKFRRQPGEYASHLWNDALLRSFDTEKWQQVVIPLPPGATSDDLERLDFVAHPASKEIILSGVDKLFSLDENDLPRFWKPSWTGHEELRPGERLRFVADNFVLRRLRTIALADEWRFKPDPFNLGGPNTWGDSEITDSLWPVIHAGQPWHQQGYAGYEGSAWYRTSFRVDKSWRGERLWLSLGEVAGQAEIWVNGKPVIRREEIGAVSQYPIVEISPQLKFQSENSLAVRVTSQASGGGIFSGPIGIGNSQEALRLESASPRLTGEIDTSEPFEYMTDAWIPIGTPKSGLCGIVMPEGGISTNFNDYVLMAGSNPESLGSGKKVLQDGYLPIVNYGSWRAGINYDVVTFAAELGTAGPAIFVRATITNRDSIGKTIKFGIALRRCGARNPSVAGGSYSSSTLSIDGPLFKSNGRIVCHLPSSSDGLSWSVYRSDSGDKLQLEGCLSDFYLSPFDAREFVFALPAFGDTGEAFNQLKNIGANEQLYRQQLADSWQTFLNSGTSITVPEAKLNQAIRANLIFNKILFTQGPRQVQWTVCQRLPIRHSLMDKTQAATAFDALGFHQEAGELLREVLEESRAAPPAQVEVDTGATLSNLELALTSGALARHVELTRDTSFARANLAVIRQVLKAPSMSNHHEGAAAEIISPSEMLAALLSSDDGKSLAGSAGDQVLAESFDKARTKWQELLKLELASLPDSEDARSAQPLVALFLRSRLDASVVPISSLLELESDLRGAFDEGLSTRSTGRWLDPLMSTAIARVNLLGRDLSSFLSDLYNLLFHSSASHFMIGNYVRPWGDRTNHGPPAIGNQAGSQLLILMREMLLREDSHELHLLSGMSPAWLQLGAKIDVQNAATTFGSIAIRYERLATGYVLQLYPQWQVVPRAIVLHIPDFLKVTGVFADNSGKSFNDGSVELSPFTREVKIECVPGANFQPMSYRLAVEAFAREYRGRLALQRATTATTP